MKKKRYHEAIPIYEKILNGLTLIGKQNSKRILTIMDNLVNCYEKSFQILKAIGTYQEIINKKKITFGENHSSTIKSMETLAWRYRLNRKRKSH